MKKGFTLLEIIVVLIILGIIATLGFLQYTRVIEKGRTAEAKTNLGTIRTMAMAYYEENGVYFQDAHIASVLGLPNDCGNTSYYFSYTIDDGTGDVFATRCDAGGKPPPCGGAGGTCPYTLQLTQAGVGSSAEGMW